jgi:hypothetical protein
VYLIIVQTSFTSEAPFNTVKTLLVGAVKVSLECHVLPTFWTKHDLDLTLDYLSALCALHR